MCPSNIFDNIFAVNEPFLSTHPRSLFSWRQRVVYSKILASTPQFSHIFHSFQYQEGSEGFCLPLLQTKVNGLLLDDSRKYHWLMKTVGSSSTSCFHPTYPLLHSFLCVNNTFCHQPGSTHYYLPGHTGDANVMILRFLNYPSPRLSVSS